MKIAKQKRSKAKPIIITLVVLALLAGGYAAYAYYKDVWPFTPSSPLHSSDDKNKATSSSEEDPNEMPPRSENDPSDEANPDKKDQDEALKKGNKTQGKKNTAGSGISDTHGKDATKNSGGKTSSSGAITLYSPQSGQTLKDGISVSGAAKVSTVQYRFSNPVDGQIALGQLSVKNGKFSGTLSVNNAHSVAGTFEVFSFDSQGREVNNVRISVNF